MHTLRIGCVKYLNACPLIRGWQGEVDFDHPSALCKRLAKGELDVALVSSFELLRNPTYRIVDDVSISSDGPVYSVLVAHHGDISEIEEIELDPASETAVNLLHCLLAELELNPRLVECTTGSLPATGWVRRGEPVAPASVSPAVKKSAARTARLLIGDQAIRFRKNYSDQFEFWDLGEQWKKHVGLPFVYALWLIRLEVANAKEIANRLRELRDENLANLDELIGADKEFDHQFLSRYYREHLRFSFGEKEKEGLQTFATLCATHHLRPKGDLTFTFV